MFLRQLFQCKFLTVLLLLGSTFYTATGRAEVWADVRDNVINNNGVINTDGSANACTQCHSYLKTVTVGVVEPAPLSRHSAPDTANFDGISDITAYNNITALSTIYGAAADPTYGFVDTTNDLIDNAKDRIYEWAADFINTGFMPMDPTVDILPGPPDGIIDTFVDAADLDTTKKALILNWALQGAPYAAPTATTDNNPTSITKLSAVVQGDFNTNVHFGTAVPGTYYFEYGTTTGYGSSTEVSPRSLTSTLFNTTKSIPATPGVSPDLKCGTLYHYRARATNGSAAGVSAAAGVDRTFRTLDCTAPVVAGVTITGNETSQTATEDADKEFFLTVSDDDPGVLNWTKTNGVNGGTVTLLSVTTSSATVRYLSAPDYFGPDTFTVTVTNATSAMTVPVSPPRVITFNMTVTDDNNDAPVISGTTTINNYEDGVNAANGMPTPIVVSLSASDVDASPTYHWDVTAANDGAPGISVNTGAAPTINYLPLANDNGSPADTFTVRVCDGGAVGTGNCDSQLVTVNLAAQQDNPTAVGEVSGINVLEGATNVSLTVIGNDLDPDAGEALTLVPVNVSVTSGDLTSVSVVGQQISVSHGGAEETTASLTYQVQDTTGRISANMVTANITVVGTDDPPTSANLTVAGTVDEATTSTIDLVIISNDPENATLAVCNTMTAPTSGNASVTIISSGPDRGKVLYSHDGTNVPAGGFADTFTYQVNDANNAACSSGMNSGFSTVTVNLAPVNDAPVAVVDSITVAEGGAATVLVGGNTSVLTNDTDEENGTGTGFTVSGNSTPAFSQAFSLNNADGTFSYQHDSSENFSSSFTYTVNDGAADSVAAGTVNITVTPVNDQPLINSMAPSTAMVLTEQTAANVYQVTQTDPDDGSFTYSLGATALAGDTPAGNMAINASGLVAWTPPRRGVFNKPTTMVTVTVSDVDASTAGANILSDSQSFMVATSPLDSDSDGVADYSDNCPSIPNAGQQDLDNDTVRILPQTDPSGIPADGDVDPAATDSANALAESYLKGGDACDEDADGDGLSNAYENLFTFLDPLDPADAAADEDGDGVSNLDEFLASTAPDKDSVGPTVNAPADITVDATGLLTVVDLGMATGNDLNEGESTLFKAAVGLTQQQKDDLAVAISGCQLFSDYETDIEPFRPGKHIVTWATCDSSGNSGQDDQVVNVKPLVSVSSGQSVGEGQAVEIDVVLNGDAIDSGSTVNYTVTGTAVAVDDHDAVSGTVIFNSPGNVGTISFNTETDGVTEADETVVFTLSSPNGVALSNARVHTVKITEANLAPQVALDVTQPNAVNDKQKGNAVYQLDGPVSIVADASDGNGDVLSFDWSASDASLLAAATIVSNQIDFDPNSLTAGSAYMVKVAVSDGSESVAVERLLRIKLPEANNWLIGQDDDGDGIDNLGEGYGDDDGDGIPNYKDNASTPANAIENQTGNLASSILIETDPGLRIAMGETALAAEASGVLIGKQDIADHGGAGGIAVSNADTDYTFYSGLLNFEISGLTDGIDSAHVVVPLSSAIQKDSVYRKYNSTGWFDFVEDDMNELRSAAGGEGACPQPGSNLYGPGLSVGDLCLQLTIQDGGANDADGLRNYIVKDPGGLALAPEPEAVADNSAEQASGRAGSLSLWLLLMLSITVAISWRLRLHQTINVRTLMKHRYSSSQR